MKILDTQMQSMYGLSDRGMGRTKGFMVHFFCV